MFGKVVAGGDWTLGILPMRIGSAVNGKIRKI